MRGEGSSDVLIVRSDRAFKLTNLGAKTFTLNRFVLANSMLLRMGNLTRLIGRSRFHALKFRSLFFIFTHPIRKLDVNILDFEYRYG